MKEKVARPAFQSSEDPHPKTKAAHPIADILQMLLGCIIAGTTFNVLLLGNGIASGGIVGISLLVSNFGIEPAFTQWAFNLTILLAALKVLGKDFALRSLLGMLALPLVVFLTRDLPPLTDNLVLAALTGGAGLGLGMGLVFRANGSVGGFSTLALLAYRKLQIPVDRSILFLDSLVIIGALVIFRNAELVLGAMLCVFFTGRTARGILGSLSTAKVVTIITRQADLLSERLIAELGAGVTRSHCKGAFTGEERETLLSVVRMSEVVGVKRIIQHYDPDAFVVISDTSEVLGYGFGTLH